MAHEPVRDNLRQPISELLQTCPIRFSSAGSLFGCWTAGVLSFQRKEIAVVSLNASPKT